MPFDWRNAWKASWRTDGTALLITAPVPPLAIVTGATAGIAAFIVGGFSSRESVNNYAYWIDSALASVGDGIEGNNDWAWSQRNVHFQKQKQQNLFFRKTKKNTLISLISV
jgi:hypothetical protein